MGIYMFSFIKCSKRLQSLVTNEFGVGAVKGIGRENTNDKETILQKRLL